MSTAGVVPLFSTRCTVSLSSQSDVPVDTLVLSNSVIDYVPANLPQPR
jgi:hypothetical protein